MRKALVLCCMFAFAAVSCSEKGPQNDGPKPNQPETLVIGSFELNVDDLKADGVTITITPSKEVDYYYACLVSDTQAYLGGEDQTIVWDQLSRPNAEQMIFRGKQTLTFSGLVGHSHYRLLYFQYDSKRNTIFGDLHRSERITTPEGEEKFSIEVTNISGLSADIAIMPEDKNSTYYFYVDEMVDYTTQFEDSNNLLIQNDFGYWNFLATVYEEESWLVMMREDLSKGDVAINTDQIYNVLMWDAEYLVYAYGLNADGDVTTQMTKKTFKTKPLDTEDTTFDINIVKQEWAAEYSRYEIEATITPSNNDTRYFVTITNKDWYDWFLSDDNEASDVDVRYQMLLNASRGSHDILADMCLSGENTYQPAVIRQQYFSPNKEYGVFVFGLNENGPTTPLAVYAFTTPAAPSKE